MGLVGPCHCQHSLGHLGLMLLVSFPQCFPLVGPVVHPVGSSLLPLGVVFGVSLILHLVIFPGSYFLRDTMRCSFFGWTAKLSATFACDIIVLKNLLCNSIWTAATSQWVACLAGIVSSFGWKGHDRTTLEHSSSNVSSAANLSFFNLTFAGLHRFPGMQSWMRGQTALCIMKANCSSSNILPR